MSEEDQDDIMDYLEIIGSHFNDQQSQKGTAFDEEDLKLLGGLRDEDDPPPEE